MTPMVKSYTSWQPLEEIIVGKVYTPDYFDFIEDVEVKNQLSQLLNEANEDLDNLQRFIEQYGAKVVRPDLPDRDVFVKGQTGVLNYSIPVPPLTPRDWQITLGEKLLRVLPIREMDNICQGYELAQPGSVVDPHGRRFNPDHILNNCQASCIVRVGRDVFFDNTEWLTDIHLEWIKENVLDDRYRVRRAVTDGHGDAVFAILKPGVILSSKHDVNINFAQDFPGWDVCKIWDSSIEAAIKVAEFKQENFNGRWYVPGVNPTEQFATFVDTYLKQWTGFIEETVFDVNCLVLDEQNVVFSSYNKQVFDYCRKHKIEPHVVEQRHKYFFDSGISCCTQDIRRRGELESYLA